MAIWKRSGFDAASLTQLQANTMSDGLGIEIVAVGEDTLTARMPVDHRTIQPHGRLHGGASVALAETVGSIAANLVLDPAESVGVGLEINANHVRPVSGGFVFATARAESLGRTTQIWSIRITDPADRLVCICRFTVAVIPAGQAKPVSA
jgi:1,4-dihydroxy-2-naphthoyl-CoA hydrolase